MKRVLKLVVICYIFFIFITGCGNDNLNGVNNKLEATQTTTNLPVDIIYNEEAYVVEGDIPDAVDITINGSDEDVESFKTVPKIILDLTEYKELDNQNKVYFTCSNCSENLTYKIKPESVNIKLREKVSTVKIVDLKLINENKLDKGIRIKKTELSHESVVIKGSEDTLNKVDTVKAIIDLSDINLSNTNYYVLNNIELSAYDKYGKVIDSVEIVPIKTTAMITVSKN